MLHRSFPIWVTSWQGAHGRYPTGHLTYAVPNGWDTTNFTGLNPKNTDVWWGRLRRHGHSHLTYLCRPLHPAVRGGVGPWGTGRPAERGRLSPAHCDWMAASPSGQ
jgi:hypothetical protein